MLINLEFTRTAGMQMGLDAPTQWDWPSALDIPQTGDHVLLRGRAGPSTFAVMRRRYELAEGRSPIVTLLLDFPAR